MQQSTSGRGDRPPRAVEIIVPTGFSAAVLALIVLAGVGPGYQFDLWSFGTAFMVMGWAAWLGLGSVGVSLLGAVFNRRAVPRTPLWLALSGIILGGVAAFIPWQWQQTAARLPYIHDISTDTEDPPVFVTLLAARADAPNTSDYGGPKVAVQQKAAYPDIVPVELEMTPDQALGQAQAAIYQLGWDVVGLVAAEGRIEAVDTTTWFGFKDDVVIRVRPVPGVPGRARVDVRSVSRVGRSDLGANAARIREFVALLSE